MKVVLFDSGSFTPWMVGLANSLSKKIDTVLVIPDNAYKLTSFLSKNVIFAPYYLPRQRNPLSFFTMVDIARTIRRHNLDILHIQSYGHTWFFVAIPIIRKYPMINTVHDPITHAGDKNTKGYYLSVYLGLKSIVATFTDRYIVHGKTLKKALVGACKVSEDIVDVIPLGNLSLYKKLGTKNIKPK